MTLTLPTAPTTADAAERPVAAPSAARAIPGAPASAPLDAPGGVDPALAAWVTEIAALTRPARIRWCDGSQAERDELIREMVATGTLLPVNPEHRHYSFVARSHPSDTARVEQRTFVCTATRAEAGANNNWEEPAAMRRRLAGLFEGAMAGRTLYVMPFALGPLESAFTRFGVQLTDSPYVVVSTGVMTRMGRAALDRIDAGAEWVAAVHSVGAPLAEGEPDVAWPCHPDKHIVHFPADREIWSFGSAYGGNAILAKKSMALRIASAMARDEGWLAEHMLLLRLTSPGGRRLHLAAAFPSACGKTNLAMLVPTIPGWKVETLGDDIAWLRIDREGRLRAVNPETGFFGVAPGTGPRTNPNALAALWGNTIFTNVALRADGDVWWEGLTPEPPIGLVDWTGAPWAPGSGAPAAHPNARFTVAATQCPSLADDWADGEGVVIDAIVFGGRRADTIPLVAEAHDWAHGVLAGATLSSERTAAQEGEVGRMRRDPFAMLPFLGYGMTEHWAHWLRLGERLRATGTVPRIFQVNWFRTGADGAYLWPGFGENLRVLAWIADRVAGWTGAQETPIGRVPHARDIDLTGLGLSDEQWRALIAVDREEWAGELDDIEEFFGELATDGAEVPAVLLDRVQRIRSAFADAGQGAFPTPPRLGGAEGR